MSLLPSHRIINAKVLAATKTNALCYRKGTLYTLDYSNWKLMPLCQLPMSSKNRMLSKCRLTERLLRLESRTACVLDEENILISFQGYVYRINLKDGGLVKELEFRPRMNNPLSFVAIKGLKGFEDSVLFGEYFSNNSFEEVKVWQRVNNQWREALSLPAGTLYHIHAIVPDYNNDCLYILTGDSDKESAILKVTDNFKTVIPVLQGSQQYRACVAFPYKDGLIYATDTPREVNHVYYAYPNNEGWAIEPVCELPGPCIYGHCQYDAYYFATSVEADDTLPPFRYRFTYKLGAGVKERISHVVKIDKNLSSTNVLGLKKDIWPMLIFQFGNCWFPVNERTDLLMICPTAVKRYDGKTILIEL